MTLTGGVAAVPVGDVATDADGAGAKEADRGAAVVVDLIAHDASRAGVHVRHADAAVAVDARIRDVRVGALREHAAAERPRLGEDGAVADLVVVDAGYGADALGGRHLRVLQRVWIRPQ